MMVIVSLNDSGDEWVDVHELAWLIWLKSRFISWDAFPMKKMATN